MISEKTGVIVSAVVLSGLMSCMVSGVATARGVGIGPDFMLIWVRAWIPSWMIACPVMLIMGPVVRRFVAKFVSLD